MRILFAIAVLALGFGLQIKSNDVFSISGFGAGGFMAT
jgi:hypothetical protein